jgi:hypothetical protein
MGICYNPSIRQTNNQKSQNDFLMVVYFTAVNLSCILVLEQMFCGAYISKL